MGGVQKYFISEYFHKLPDTEKKKKALALPCVGSQPDSSSGSDVSFPYTTVLLFHDNIKLS